MLNDHADKDYLRQNDVHQAREKLGHEFGWLDKQWRYVPSHETNIKRTMDRARMALTPYPWRV